MIEIRMCTISEALVTMVNSVLLPFQGHDEARGATVYAAQLDGLQLAPHLQHHPLVLVPRNRLRGNHTLIIATGRN